MSFLFFKIASHLVALTGLEPGYVAQAGLKLVELLLPQSPVWWLQACTTISSSTTAEFRRWFQVFDNLFFPLFFLFEVFIINIWRKTKLPESEVSWGHLSHLLGYRMPREHRWMLAGLVPSCQTVENDSEDPFTRQAVSDTISKMKVIFTSNLQNREQIKTQYHAHIIF